jgi:polysaccharide biosynthesis/export protein
MTRFVRFETLQALLLTVGILVASGRGQTIAASGAASGLESGSADHSHPGSIPAAVSGNSSSQFALGPADVLRINVWKNADLSQTVTVGPDGFISLPLLGDVHVAGMTANQLTEQLSERLEAYVVSPQVTVSVVEVRSRQVYVLGQVGKPGSYPLMTPVTVLQLIAQAGGLTTYANRKQILILRQSNGNTQRLRFNYASTINGDDKQNIALQPGDTVIVR